LWVWGGLGWGWGRKKIREARTTELFPLRRKKILSVRAKKGTTARK